VTYRGLGAVDDAGRPANSPPAFVHDQEAPLVPLPRAGPRDLAHSRPVRLVVTRQRVPPSPPPKKNHERPPHLSRRGRVSAASPPPWAATKIGVASPPTPRRARWPIRRHSACEAWWSFSWRRCFVIEPFDVGGGTQPSSGTPRYGGTNGLRAAPINRPYVERERLQVGTASGSERPRLAWGFR
jgi:hypothetical protein